MSTINLSVKYRPVKIGFLVESGDVNALVKAAGMNNLLWGGIHNPIIPVSDDITFAEKIIKLFSVDVLCPTSHTTPIDNLMKKNKFLKLPNFYGKNIFLDKNESLIAYLDSYNVIYNIYESDFKNKTNKDAKSNFRLVRWNKNDKLANLFAICFGYFPKSYNLKVDFEKAYLNGLQAKEVNIDSSKEINYDQTEYIYQLLLTGLELTPIYDRFFPSNGIFIGDKDNFSDLLYFWNLRAAGFYVFFLPQKYIQTFKRSAEKYIEKLDNKPSLIKNLDDYISIYYNSINENKIKEIVKKLNAKKELCLSCCKETFWNNGNIRPAKYHFKEDNILGFVDKPYSNYNISFKLPEKSFINDSKNIINQKLLVSIKTTREFAYPEHTINPPFIAELNEFYGREITSHPNDIRIEKDGIAKIIDGYDDFLSLYPLSYKKIFEKIFEYAQIKIDVSQAGLITKRIIEKLGRLEGGRVFKIKGVRKLFREMKTNCYKTRKAIEKIFWDSGKFKKYEKLFIEPRENKALKKGKVFDFLLKKDFLRAGLELKCDNCRLKDWISLKELDDWWDCRFCGYRNRVSLHLNDQGEWKYRKSGLFAKDNNQEGALPVILTLLQLRLLYLHSSEFLYSSSLKLEFDSTKCEIDFCTIPDDINGKIEIGIAECKDQGGEINQGDIEHFKSIRNKLKKVRIECYFIFSKTAKFTPTEINLFKNLEKENIGCILFTDKELEPYYPYEEYKDKELPYKHPMSLKELAINSKYIYLNYKKKKATPFYEIES
ncbi:hypothetical protein ES704_00844 [subsurface metagenome]|jgi:hypothetical protein